MYTIVPFDTDIIKNSLEERVEFSRKCLTDLLELTSKRDLPIDMGFLTSKLSNLEADKRREIDNLMELYEFPPVDRVFLLAKNMFDMTDEEDWTLSESICDGYRRDFTAAIQAYYDGDKDKMMNLLIELWVKLGAAAPVEFDEETWNDIEVHL